MSTGDLPGSISDAGTGTEKARYKTEHCLHRKTRRDAAYVSRIWVERGRLRETDALRPSLY